MDAERNVWSSLGLFGLAYLPTCGRHKSHTTTTAKCIVQEHTLDGRFQRRLVHRDSFAFRYIILHL
jgi:hypothetical protein